MQEKYPNVSTYAYCVQNPVKFIDPDGKDPIGGAGDALSAFAAEVAVSSLENYLPNDMDASSALKNVRWGDAFIEAGKSYAISFIVTGAGTTKSLAKAANSKVGKVAIEFSANIVTYLIKKYNNGEFNNKEGKFDITKLAEVDYMDVVISAGIESLMSHGYSKKADDLAKKLKKSTDNLTKQKEKLIENRKNHTPDSKVVQNRIKKVINAKHDVFNNFTKQMILQTTSETTGKVSSKSASNVYNNVYNNVKE